MRFDELADAWERAWSGHDPAAFAPLAADGFQYEDPLTSAPLRGADGVAAHAARLWAAFPDARVERTGARLADGRYLAAPARLLGTHLAPLEGLAPSGKAVVVQVAFYSELAQGRFLRVRAFYDVYGAAMALGVVPRPGSLGEKALLTLRGFGLRVGGATRFER